MYSRSMLQASIRHSGTYVPLHNTYDFIHIFVQKRRTKMLEFNDAQQLCMLQPLILG